MLAPAGRHRHRERQSVGRWRRASSRPSTTSTRCRRCTRSSAVMACARPTSSPIRSRRTRDRPTCCARCASRGRARSARIITPGRRRRARPRTSQRHPYAADLPRDQFERSSSALTAAIESAVGERPVSYRSGRFGFSAAHVSSLERAGYRVESSVAPLFYEAHKRGPDFADAPLTPYFLAYDHATRPGRARCWSCRCRRRSTGACRAGWPWPTRGRRSNYTDQARAAQARAGPRAWLRPSYSSLDDMIGLARRLAEAGVPLLNLLFHSSEAIVGGSPYNRTHAELDAFLDRLDRFLAFATRELKAEPLTFTEFRDRYLARRPAHELAGRRRLGASAHRPESHGHFDPRACLAYLLHVTPTCRRTRPPTRCCRRIWDAGRATPAMR